ncbi:MAG: AAA family ATPase, partial [Chloroflexi bacterium HGW-Chloroflexi-8]
RFMMKIKIGYPGLTDEIQILNLQKLQHPIEQISMVAAEKDIRLVQESIKNVYVSEPIKKYIVELTRATREHTDVYLGVSPRGSLNLFRASQAKAAISGRDYVLPDDVKNLARFVMGHRMVVQPSARLRNLSSEQIISEVINSVSVPGGDFRGN